MTDDLRIEQLRRHMDKFKRPLKARLDEDCEAGLYMLEFCLLHDVVDDLERFGRLKVSDASQNGRCSMYINRP